MNGVVSFKPSKVSYKRQPVPNGVNAVNRFKPSKVSYKLCISFLPAGRKSVSNPLRLATN